MDRHFYCKSKLTFYPGPKKQTLVEVLGPLPPKKQSKHKIEFLSSKPCRAACANIPDRLSPSLPIIHRLRQVFRVTSRVLT